MMHIISRIVLICFLYHSPTARSVVVQNVMKNVERKVRSFIIKYYKNTEVVKYFILLQISNQLEINFLLIIFSLNILRSIGGYLIAWWGGAIIMCTGLERL